MTSALHEFLGVKLSSITTLSARSRCTSGLPFQREYWYLDFLDACSGKGSGLFNAGDIGLILSQKHMSS